MSESILPDLRTEEDVKIKSLLPFLHDLGYEQDTIDFEVAVDVQEGRKKKTIYADAVIYASKKKVAPLIVCETKAPNEILNKAGKEQVISYARLLPRIAPLALLTNGHQIQVFHTLDKTRLRELPSRTKLDADIVSFVVNRDTQDALRREAKHELFIIDDVKTFKNILRSCHNEIRNNEGLDPTAAFDEMSKIMFCKLFEEKENPKGNRFRLSVFDDSLSRLGINVAKKILEDAKKAPGYKEIFSPDAKIQLKDRTIRKIVELFENYDLGLTAFDVKGEAFEFFLGETFTGGLGEYFTPRNVVEFMVEALSPKIGETIIDPFCGTGGFLICAFEVVSERIRLQEFSEEEKQKWRLELSNRCLFGTDWKERTSQACKMNMMVHGDGSSGIFMHDGFLDVEGAIEEGKFDLTITNPPFGSFETDKEILNAFELGAGRNSQDRVILAIERCLRLSKVGGRVGIIVIDGVLNNPSTKYVRDYIRRQSHVRAVISLNKETFEQYGARAKTSILILEKKDPDAPVKEAQTFMAIARNTGVAPNGDDIPGNELPDILLDLQEFSRNGEIQSPKSHSWGENCDDRLDAEFYNPYRPISSQDLVSIEEGLSSGLAKSLDTISSLIKIKDSISGGEFEDRALGDLLTEKKERVELADNESYTLLGVKWWGGGVFIREQKPGREIKAKYLYKVASGWIIYNRLFAYRGSFAILEKEHEGCFVSGEFPTFAVKDGYPNPALLSRYLVHYLNSPRYLAVIDAQSTGSTPQSRNRFNQKLFEKLVVPIPKSEGAMKKMVMVLNQADRLRWEQDRITDLAKSYRDGVLDLLPHSSEDQT